MNGRALEPIHDRISEPERLWSERLDQLEAEVPQCRLTGDRFDVCTCRMPSAALR